VTSDSEIDYEPVWSHDGRYIYFSSFREGTIALWRVPADGGAPRRLTPGSGPESHPTVAVDGARLAYTTFAENPDLVVRDLTTGAETELTGLREELTPAFAPDGSAVLFVSDRAGKYDLWIQPLSSQGPAGPARRLTDDPGSAAHPSYSPDGRWVAYYRNLAGSRHVWTVPAGGGEAVRFSDSPGNDFHPDWSPDGKSLAYIVERDGRSSLVVAPASEGRLSGKPREIVSNPVVLEGPRWSPDGKWLAYVAETGGDVWVVPADGGQPARPVTRGAQAYRVRWEGSSRSLLVSGFWGTEQLTLRAVSVDGGETRATPVTMGRSPIFSDFDISRDGRLVVFSRARSRGDIWILQAQARSY
jgi:Tol biopolymer transport system component